eukprot:CAMPEP_0170279694 /NCGR_PEP_ID=MMETSP0116_2-20130129/39859_1 /TAXON_ID=400756 /ORGANISM="Durinskia baltica, Strain CSIRO CS-38" /LENGTH=32 /DNA_ID= /DNA_START= /DNA_END= /DNA_ORIENTATION=
MGKPAKPDIAGIPAKPDIPDNPGMAIAMAGIV